MSDAEPASPPWTPSTLVPDGLAMSEADIIAHCRETMAHFKCPTRVIFGELPKTSTGKIQKFVLREAARAPHRP